MNELIAQIVGLFAMAFNVLSYQQKTQKDAIALQLGGSILFSINYLMLGAIVGGILNTVAIIRALVFLNRDKTNATHPLWLHGFLAVYLLSYVLTFTVFGKEPTVFNLILEFLPVIAMTATTISFRLDDATAIRRFGLISSPSWMVYDLVSMNLGAILCELLSLSSIFIGMSRLDRKQA